mgnify:FL=1|jgi:hypothetical protein|tara:strand:+ start:59 stop:247 length:189 start_codon:yes stop_codon:yes gene_type:complete
MRIETREAMEMLFAAKWNVPTAAKHCNLTRKEMMITFNEYCALHPPTYTVFDNAIQLDLDIK